MEWSLKVNFPSISIKIIIIKSRKIDRGFGEISEMDTNNPSLYLQHNTLIWILIGGNVEKDETKVDSGFLISNWILHVSPLSRSYLLLSIPKWHHTRRTILFPPLRLLNRLPYKGTDSPPMYHTVVPWNQTRLLFFPSPLSNLLFNANVPFGNLFCQSRTDQKKNEENKYLRLLG